MESLIGKTLICAKTGKTFIGAADGCTTNYARGSNGEIYSDEGVQLINQESVKNESKIHGYVDIKNRVITGWKGDVMLKVTHTKSTKIRSNWGCVYSVWARDSYGFEWYGRGCDGCALCMRKIVI